ncbi:MAG: chorismate-binding protein [Bdellovibrionales bacterium]
MSPIDFPLESGILLGISLCFKEDGRYKNMVEGSCVFSDAQGVLRKAKLTAADAEFCPSGEEWKISLPVFSLTTWRYYRLSEVQIQTSTNSPLHKLSLNLTSGSRELFSSFFSKVQDSIHNGSIEKAVIYTDLKLERKLSEAEKKQITKNLVSNYVKGNLIIIDTEDFYLASNSPEILFRVSENQYFESMALAGTHVRSDDPKVEKSFLFDSKERAEHELVVQFLKESLEIHMDLNFRQTDILKLERLMHLRTVVSSNWNSKLQAIDILKSLHPTPALGSYPKNSFNEGFLRMDELLPRHYFGSSVLLESEKNKLAIVLIRMIQSLGGSTHIPTGCGIVAESLINNEWAEVQLKREQVLKDMGIHESKNS